MPVELMTCFTTGVLSPGSDVNQEHLTSCLSKLLIETKEEAVHSIKRAELAQVCKRVVDKTSQWVTKPKSSWRWSDPSPFSSKVLDLVIAGVVNLGDVKLLRKACSLGLENLGHSVFIDLGQAARLHMFSTLRPMYGLSWLYREAC